MLALEQRFDHVNLRAFVPPLIVVGTLLASFLAGRLQVMMPVLGPALLVGVAFIPLMLMINVEWLIIGTITLTLCSRVLLLVGAPSLVNYAHFGLMLITIISVALRRIVLRWQSDPMANRIYLGLTIFTVWILASALINEWHALRPVVFWLLFAEPFLILAFMLNLHERGRKRVRNALLVLAVIQIPFALTQFAQYGTGDFVKGTMIAQGAGHHVLGAVGIMGAALFIADPRRAWWGRFILLGLVPLLLGLGIMSDAKQVYGAFAVAAIPFVLPLVRSRLPVVLVAIPLLIAVFVVGTSINSSLQNVTDRDQVEGRLDQKFGYFERVMEEMHGVDWWIGKGPGNGLSRVALLTFPSYGNVPEFLVGSSQPDMAVPFVEEEQDKIRRKMDTSAGSAFSSVLGLFTEIGIVGCVVYLSLGRQVWKVAARCPPFEKNIGQSMLIMALVLGAIYTWLDEPAFVVYLAALIGSLLPSAESGLAHEDGLGASATVPTERLLPAPTT